MQTEAVSTDKVVTLYIRNCPDSLRPDNFSLFSSLTRIIFAILFAMNWLSRLFLTSDGLPRDEEILILGSQPEEVLQMLHQSTKADREGRHKNDHERYAFHGTISGDTFTIAPTLAYPSNYVPRIEGRIAGTSLGCVVWLNYRLFPSTQLFLVLGSAMLLSLLMLFMLAFPNVLYALTALLAGIGNYWITLTSFRKQTREAHERLLRILEEQRQE